MWISTANGGVAEENSSLEGKFQSYILQAPSGSCRQLFIPIKVIQVVLLLVVGGGGRLVGLVGVVVVVVGQW
ncbi:hypothetical protein CSUI_005575 [Cystoisospora suis]|uniref:Transmembrane protein n=1 Tax=Cystoisospora suis TaxID=483139 RepID=A0A2C6KJA7_9APIC|nr:hypothetical protein CSUI_005575 [Cystoisospora suis]